MTSASNVDNENPASQVPMANELGNLRNYFAPTSIFGAGMYRNSIGDTLVDRRSPLQLDNAFVQQTKDQIRLIVEDVAKLAHAPIEPDHFVQAALPKIVSAMGASGAALWHQLPDLSWRLIGSLNLPNVLLEGEVEREQEGDELQRGRFRASSSRLEGFSGPSPSRQEGPTKEGPTREGTTFEQLDFIESQLRTATESMPRMAESCDPNLDDVLPSESHLSVLNAVARERQPILIPPRDALLNRDRPANPTSELLIFAPLLIPKEQGNYWLQIVQSPSGGPASQRGYLRFVAQMADLMSDYFRSHRLRVFERDREYLSLAEHTMNELTGSLNPRLGLAKLMKTIREHAQSEHALLLRRESIRGRWRVVGAAGLVEIDRKADGIGQIERASSVFQAMFQAGGAMTSAQIPKGYEERDRDLARLWNTFAITELQWIKPLIANLSATDNPKQSWATSDVLPLRMDVAILLTWSGNDRPPSRCSEQCALIARLGLSALQVPWWKKALRANKTTKPNAMAFASPGSWPRPVKWLVLLTLLSFVFALPVPIRLHATAILVPLVQQHVFAPMDATVEAVLVEHGQSVKLGDPLIRLRSPSLSAEYEQTLAQQLRNAQRLEDIEATLLRGTALSPSQKEELEGERKTIASIRPIETNQLASLRKQLESLLIVANVDGVVSTWNVQESLRDRPLRTGQWLMSIHESESPWILEATLSERDSYEFRLAMENGRNQPIAMMTSLPQTELPIRLRKSFLPRIDSGQHAVAAIEPNSSVLRLQFDLEAETIPAKVAVAGATARISIPVGRGPLIWALSKDFANSVWTRILLWI